ncbi:MAG TPA: hypothetical protein IGQ44_12970 [Geminocystis sp. M7585_C2015_104]|nr:hypothetical protein [Geminocystis sp. M7585_C2015_104]
MHAKAREIVHSPKGVCGSLGTEELFLASRDLEMAIINQNTTQIQTILPSFNAAFDRVFNSLSLWLKPGYADNTTPQNFSPNTLENWPEIQSILKNIPSLLESDLVEAKKQLLSLQKLTQDTPLSPLVSLLLHHFHQLDFDSLLSLLRQLEGGGGL